MSDRLTAMDMENQEFRQKLRGFDPAEVRLYLKSVGEEVGRLNLHNGEQREELGHLRQKIEAFAAREASLQNAIVSAQRISEEMVQQARAEADLVVREARTKAERMLQQSQEQLLRIEDEIGRAKLERTAIERELRSVVEHHLELLDQRLEHRGEQEQDRLFVMPRQMTGSEAG